MKLAIGGHYRTRLGEALNKFDAEVIWLPDNPNVDERLAGHADLSVFSADKVVVTADCISHYIVNLITNEAEVLKCSVGQGAVYPNDVPLCACYTGKYLIYNPKTADPVIANHAPGVPIIVSQGYTNCSVCVVSDNAIITSDSIISSRAAQAGLDVLQITPGHILLDGFDYGFIGGAAFLLNGDDIAFTGVLTMHPDRDKILHFVDKHGKNPVFLTNAPIFDIGGAVALP